MKMMIVNCLEAIEALEDGGCPIVVDYGSRETMSMKEYLARMETEVEFIIVVPDKDMTAPMCDMVVEFEPEIDPRDPTASAAIEAVEPPKQKKKRSCGELEKYERKRQARKIDDPGKCKALRDAGWTLKKIADEFNVSVQTVSNTLLKLEQQEREKEVDG